MKEKKKIAIAAITAACLLCSCSQGANGETIESDSLVQVTTLDPATLFSDRDQDSSYDESQAVSILLDDTETTTTDQEKVSISNSTITIQEEGVYELSGALTNGQIIVDAQNTDKVQLVLKGAAINCNTSAAIYVRQAEKVFLTLAEGTENTLSNQGEFVAIDENTIDGVVFAKDDLTINGSGSVTIDAAYGSGVVGKDDLIITGGTYQITAAEHGFAGKDCICIADGNFQVDAGKDGFHSENKDDTTKGYLYVGNGKYTVTAEGDGFDSGAMLQVDDGTFQIQTGGGSEAELAEGVSAKGIKASGDLYISQGSFVLDCVEDAVHTNANLVVKNGTYDIVAGDDGFHADSQVGIENGTINIQKSYEGIEGEKVLIFGGDISIVASDDGINSAETGEDSDEAAFDPQQNPMNNGEMPEFDPENAPQMQGEPTEFDGETTATPAADGQDHEMPQRPTEEDGEMPQRPTGEDGEMPQRPTGEDGEMPTDPMGKGGSFAVSEICDIVISGGSVAIDAKGDGIDSNGTIHITGGEITVSGSENGADSPLDSNGDVIITGGKLIACGTSSMFQGFSANSTQGWAQFNLTASQSGTVSLKNGNTTLLEYTPIRAYPTVLVSCPELKDGSSYSITMGEDSQTFTMSGISYTYGTATGFGGHGMGGQKKGMKPDQTMGTNDTEQQKTTQTP